MHKPMNITVFGEGISLAHVIRPMLIAQKLQQRGHRILFLTSRRYLSWVQARGLDCQAVFTPDPEAVYARLRHLQPMYLADELRALVKADLAALHAQKPQIVLGDCRNSLRISCAVLGTPYVAITNANCTPWYAGRITAPTALPLTRLLGKATVDRWLTPLFGKMGRAAVCRLLAGRFAQVQKEYAVADRCRDFRHLFISPDLTLLADLPDFMPTANLPPNVHYVGPLFLDRDAACEQSTRSLLDSISFDRPLIYVTFGSTGEQALLPIILDVLATMDLEVIVTAPSTGQPPQKETRANIQFTAFASAGLILQRSSLVICHGGNSTIYHALSYGCPVIAVPTFFDQEAHSDQLVANGLGRRIDTGKIDSQLKPAIRQLLCNGSVTSSVISMGKQTKPSSSVAEAVQLIERHATQ